MVSVKPRLGRNRRFLASLGRPSSAFEQLEPRQMLAVTAAIDSTTVTPTQWLIVVHYRTDGAPIDLSTIHDGNIAVTAPPQTAPVVQPVYSELGRLWEQPRPQQDGSVIQVYVVTARGQAWDWGDRGTYTVTMRDSQVKDTSGSAVGQGTIGQYYLWFTTPRAEIGLATVAGSGWQFSVTYSDDSALDTSTIASGNADVYGPNGLVSTATLNTVINLGGGAYKAYYTAKIAQISASWLSRGTYDIVLRPAQIFDTAGNGIPAFGLGEYWYWNDNPAAQLVSESFGVGGLTVVMRYSDDSGINLSSVGHVAGDVQIVPAQTGSSPLLGSIVGSPVVASDGSVTATYIITSPLTGWRTTDHAYSLNYFGTGHVTDMQGHAIFGGYIIQTQDWSLSNPTAAVMSSTRVDPSTWDVSVRFTDDTSLDAWSVLNDVVLSVDSFAGFHAMVTMQSSMQQSAQVWTVTYRLHSSSGALPTGHYYLRNVPYGVQDNAGHSMPSSELLAFDL